MMLAFVLQKLGRTDTSRCSPIKLSSISITKNFFHRVAVHSFPLVSAINMINANGERPFYVLLFLYYCVIIPNLMEIILYLLRAANEIVPQYLPIPS